MKQQCQGSSANERGLLCSISYFTSHLNSLKSFSKEYIIDIFIDGGKKLRDNENSSVGTSTVRK